MSRLWIPLCLISWRQVCRCRFLCHRSACRIVRRSKNMDFPGPLILEVVPPERIQEFIAEQISVVPQTTENFVSAVQPRAYSRATRGTDFCGAPDHGEIWACASARAFRADPRTTRGCGFHQRSGQVQHASTWRCYGPCASDHGGCRGGL